IRAAAEDFQSPQTTPLRGRVSGEKAVARQDEVAPAPARPSRRTKLAGFHDGQCDEAGTFVGVEFQPGTAERFEAGRRPRPDDGQGPVEAGLDGEEMAAE